MGSWGWEEIGRWQGVIGRCFWVAISFRICMHMPCVTRRRPSQEQDGDRQYSAFFLSSNFLLLARSRRFHGDERMCFAVLNFPHFSPCCQCAYCSLDFKLCFPKFSSLFADLLNEQNHKGMVPPDRIGYDLTVWPDLMENSLNFSVPIYDCEMKWPAPAAVCPGAMLRSNRPADVCIVLQFGGLQFPVGNTESRRGRERERLTGWEE
jgi:hypothetical protein